MTANPNYPVNAPNAEPSAEALRTPPVATWFDNDPMILCNWCGYMVRFGRGATEFLDFCTICKNEIGEVDRG